MPACSRHHAIAASGSSQVENATGGLPCLRREKRSSSAAATVTPSTTRAAAGSWKTALTPRTFIGEAALREALLPKPPLQSDRQQGGRKAPLQARREVSRCARRRSANAPVRAESGATRASARRPPARRS